MKRLLLFLLVVTLPFGSFAQSVDSLLRVVKTMPEDTNRVMTFRQLFLAYYGLDQQPEMLDVAEKGLVLSRKLQFAKGIDLFLFYKASSLDIMGKSNEAIPYFEEGLQWAQKQGDKKAVANYDVNIGAAYYGIGNLDKALQHYLSAYGIYKELDMQKNLSKVLNNIGIIYRTQGKTERAEAIYKESLGIKEALKDTLGMAASYQNLAALLSSTKREVEMTNYLHNALDIYQKLGRNTDAAGCYSLLGQIHFNFGRISEAKAALLKAKTEYDQKPSVEYSATMYRLLGTIAESENNHTLAETYLLESAKWAREFGQQDRLWDVLNELSKVQNTLGKNEAAYASLRASYAIRDSVTEKNRMALMEEMQAKFDVAQKDSELKINQLSLGQRTLERNWFMVGALLFGLLSIAIFYGLRQRIRTNKKIATQESALQQQQIVQLEQANKLTALSAMIEGQEKERSRVAADLHDGLGGLLTSVKSHFNALHQPAGEPVLFEKTNRLIDDACVEVRRIAHNMMPRALSVAGLQGALEDLARDLDRQGLHCQLETVGLDRSISDATAVMVYRIVQELANNVVKHAEADHLLLQLLRHENQLTILVEDNGKGFDLEKAITQKGIGLSSIASRVQFLQGAIDWDSVPGQGTSVSIQLKAESLKF
ncbi:MAG: tetratricopeptide repeat protein [Saprospiraceae bacterium]|nr:tetratricopeptide repeat protein [Saprospiraceae bacterium]